MKTILVVEDDRDTNEIICEFLTDAGFNVLSAFDGEEAAEIFFNSKIDLCILDIMMTKKSGTELLEEIRKFSNTAVIMLTALGDEITQITAFNLRADEYVTKPFSPAVLVKRVKALLNRIYPADGSRVKIGNNIEIDFSAYTVTINGKRIDFTTKELEILKLLIENNGLTLTRQQILDKVWGMDTISIDRTVDVHIKNIRKKLDYPCIVTVKGVGYRFEK